MYDSYDPNMWEYHILLAWAAGIDGFAVDWYGMESYENPPIKGLLDKADHLWEQWNSYGFNFEIAASYNEMSHGELGHNLLYVGDSLMTHPAYWGHRRQYARPLFIFNTDEEVFMPADYRVAADTTLPEDKFLLWNGTEPYSFDPMDVLYPWVQTLDGVWDPMGLDWGESYLDTTYWRMNMLPDPGDLWFAMGAVWPGFNDKEWSMGLDRWMDRQDTLVYEETWRKIYEYNYPLSMPWVMVETWNDMNQGTDIVPTLNYDYKFIVLTRDHARMFKDHLPPDSVGVENLGLLVPQHILQARIAAEVYPDQAAAIEALIDQAMQHFFDRDFLEAISVADEAAGIVPQPFVMDNITETSIHLTWTASPGANVYYVYYTTDSSMYEPCSFVKPDRIMLGDVTEYTLTDLEAGTDYFIAVTAANSELGPYAHESWYQSTISGATVASFRTAGSAAPLSTIEERMGQIPTEFALSQNYPNPFNPVTYVEYALPEAQHVVIKVFDVQGREVKTLVNEKQPVGWYRLQIDGRELASGVYFLRLRTEQFSDLKKMVLVK
jgi:hypothetical protein